MDEKQFIEKMQAVRSIFDIVLIYAIGGLIAYVILKALFNF